jgi:hypothetical protein
VETRKTFYPRKEQQMLIQRQHHAALVAELARRVGNREYGCRRHTTADGPPAATLDIRALLPDIPATKWADLIRAQRTANLLTLTRDVLPVHDQDGTNYCWAHGSTRALEILGIYQGAPPTLLSAESIAVPITHGRNQGGTPDQAVNALQSQGACEQRFWPLNDRHANHAKPGWKENAAEHRIERWAHVPTWEAQILCAIYQLPVPIGLAWWGHLVCQTAPDLDDNGNAIIWFDNSWGPTWGNNGRATLDRDSGTATLGAFTPLTASMLAKGLPTPPGL